MSAFRDMLLLEFVIKIFSHSRDSDNVTLELHQLVQRILDNPYIRLQTPCKCVNFMQKKIIFYEEITVKYCETQFDWDDQKDSGIWLNCIFYISFL